MAISCNIVPHVNMPPLSKSWLLWLDFVMTCTTGYSRPNLLNGDNSPTLSSLVNKEHRHCSSWRGEASAQQRNCCCWTLWWHGGYVIRSLTDMTVGHLHCHHSCMQSRNINIAQERGDEGSVEQPRLLQLQLGFVRPCTTGYSRPNLLGGDVSPTPSSLVN